MSRPTNEPRYVIGIVAQMCGIETHTLRYYERIGLLKPHRSRGNVRYYSESDVELLQHIKTLTDEVGISPAGVQIVLQMARQMLDMQRHIHEMECRMRLLEEATEVPGWPQTREE